MKEILYLTVRAEVETQFEKISETVQEIEKESVVILSDTTNIRVIETELLLTRFRKAKN